MRKLDFFIIKAFIGPFVAILLVVVFILMMQFLWLYIDELVGKGLGLGVILEFLMWGVFTITPLALPLATLLSSMMVVGQMAENNELIAIKAAGIPFSRTITPLMGMSFLISVGAYFVGDKLVPEAYNQIYTLRDDIGRTKNEIKIPSGTFYDGIDGYVLRVDDQNKQTGMLYGVMVYDHTGKKGNTAVTLADSALLRMSATKDYLTFTLFNGSNYQEDNTIRRNDTTLSLQHVDFIKQELLIQLANYSFEKSDSSRFGDQAKSMSTAQLKHESDSLHHNIDSLKEINYKSLRESRLLLEAPQLDTARRNPDREDFYSEQFMTWDNEEATIQAYRKAADRLSQYNNEINNMKFTVFEQSFKLRHVDIEFLKKFAQALACFVLFFIGAPIGSLIRKGGLGTSAIISVLFFVLYWVIDISGTKLARDGAIHASTGAFISTYVLVPIGAFLSWKAIQDSELFNIDSIKSWWRRLKSKVLSFFRPTRIVFMGTPEFAVKSLDALVQGKYKVVGVVTTPDKQSGRGLKVHESAVKAYSKAHGIPVLQPLKLKDPDFLASLMAWKPDMIVVVAFRMLPEEVWRMPRLGCFNLHASLLPQYRGAAPINWALINGEKITGATTFMIDKDIDTGGIMFRHDCRIEAGDDAGSLHDKLADMGAKMVVHTAEALIQGNVELRVQRSFIQGAEILKPAPKLTKELCRIDWNKDSKSIRNLIRGLSPYPAAFTELVSKDKSAPEILKIYKAEKFELEFKGRPGQILSDGKTYFAIATSDGALSIKEMQLAGKKRMDVQNFLAGFRNPKRYSTA